MYESPDLKSSILALPLSMRRVLQVDLNDTTEGFEGLRKDCDEVL